VVLKIQGIVRLYFVTMRAFSEWSKFSIFVDEQTRKDLLHGWSLNWSGGTSQPLDAIYSYFGPKVIKFVLNISFSFSS
jgi:hypothetical protein